MKNIVRHHARRSVWLAEERVALEWHQPQHLEINAALDVPRFRIVDGIIGMEDKGPIRGGAITSKGSSSAVIRWQWMRRLQASCASIRGAWEL
jgi:hypothetical protein